MSASVSSLGSAQISSEIQTVETRLQKPVTQLQDEQTADKAIISAWGAISGTVSSLTNALSGIKDLSSINNRATASTLTTVATATATNTALAGTYNLTNVTLAKTQEIYSGILGSGAAQLGQGSGGSLTITLKNGKTETVTIGSGSATLNGVAQAINKLAGGVQATIVGTASGDRLVLQGSATGSSNGFSVTGTGALAPFSYSSATNTGGSFIRAQQAANAALKINGVPITSATNAITTAVTGLSLTLAGSGSTTVTVSSSPGGIANAVGNVATSLNSAIAAIAKQTAYVPASSASTSSSASSAQSGPLLGNFTASDLSQQLLTAVTGAASSGATSNTIGLTVNSTGAVSFNSATFSTAYAANPTGVTNLVNQIYKNLTTLTSAATGSSGDGGTIAAQVKSQNNIITAIGKEVTSLEQTNAAQLKILALEYTVAEESSSNASITESYLSIFNTSGSGSTKG